MNQFQQRVMEVVGPLIRDLERTFYDGDQAPDLLVSLQDQLNKIGRAVADIKFELDPINRYVLKQSKEESSDESSNSDANTPSIIDDLFEPSEVADVKTLADLYTDAIREKGLTGAKEFMEDLVYDQDGNFKWSCIPKLLELAGSTSTADTLGAWFESMGIGPGFANLLGEWAGNLMDGATNLLLKKILGTTGRMQSNNPCVSANPFQIGKQVTDNLVNHMDDANRTLSDKADEIMNHLNAVEKPYLQSLYSKVEECCVKGEVEDIMDTTDEINFKVSSMQPTTSVNNSLNLIMGNKMVLSKLNQIRSLL